MENSTSTPSTGLSVDPSLCHTCQSPSKYKCPRCDVRSCSVACVKQHKADQSCSGERSKTHYVSMKEYNESNMMSDYVYLEDVSRQSDTVTRQRMKENKPSNPIEYKLRMVVKQARALGIVYDMLPAGMSRRKANRTNYSTKMKQLFWTIEFCFCLDTMQERVVEHSCPSNKSLRGVFENILLSEKPQGQNSYATIRHQVQQFVDTDMNDWVIGLKKEGGKRNTYINITSLLDQPIKDSLTGERVIEYPTIYIWLKDHVDPAIQLEDKYTAKVEEEKMDADNASNSDDSSDSSEDDSSSDMDEDDSDDDGVIQGENTNDSPAQIGGVDTTVLQEGSNLADQDENTKDSAAQIGGVDITVLQEESNLAEPPNQS